MVTVVVVEIGGRGRRIHAMNVSKEKIDIEIEIGIEIDEGGHKLLVSLLQYHRMKRIIQSIIIIHYYYFDWNYYY